MDPRIWSKLPDHILDHILAFLPFWSILQLQSVSKKWRINLTSTTFLAKRAKACQPEALFVMLLDCGEFETVPAYNPMLNKWHLIPLSLFSHNEVADAFLMLTTAGGLICAQVGTWPNLSLIVSNPMNRSYRKLPPMLDMSNAEVVGMTMNPDKTGYRVLVAEQEYVRSSLVSQHYDSVSDSWKMNSSYSESGVAVLSTMVSLGEFLVFLSEWPHGLVAYNIEEGTWSNMGVEMPASIIMPFLIPHNEQLLLVGGVEDSVGIRIWKVDLSNKKCVEIENMPDPFFQGFDHLDNGNHFSCMGDAGFLWFSDNSTPQSIMYGMTEKRWWFLPPWPPHRSSQEEDRQYHYTCNYLSPLGFLLTPCFVAKA